MRLEQVCEQLERIAPAALAEDFDNIGLLIGDPGAQVGHIALSLEATQQTVAAAIKKGAALLITHHPLIFKPQKRFDLSSPTGKIIATVISSGLAIFAAHTNFDALRGGMNDALADILGFQSGQVVIPSDPEALYKLVTFVPETHIDAVSEAIFGAGGGFIGEYSGCSFRSAGQGSFRPSSKATPFSGKVGATNLEPEIRLEVQLPGKAVRGAVAAMKKAHPYDEVAYDLYSVKPGVSPHGHGRYCDLPGPMKLSELSAIVAKKLSTKKLRYVGKPSTTIDRVAVCTGSGAFMIPLVSQPERTCLITGDIKYHDARDAQDRGLSLIDAGHFTTEIHFAKTMKKLLGKRLAESGNANDMRLEIIGIERDPFELVTP